MKMTSLVKKIPFLSISLSFGAGICSVLMYQSLPFAQEASPVIDEEVIAEHESAFSQPFWEDAAPQENPLGLNFFEITDIEQENAPQITEATADQILSDFQTRVNPEFKIPELIFNQTKFWFRIYTEFDSTKKVIHDALHPHIIFDVVDISEILAQPTRAKWLNVAKAEKAVSARVHEIRNKLKKMSRKSKENMDAEELGWLAQFEEIKGNQKKIILTSSDNLRIQTGQKDFFENGLTMSSRYLEGMEAIFRQKGLPTELTRLPFVESSFVIGATSKVGAAGIWQFMPGIGRKFMMINDQIDERRNPFKATEAAAKLLKENHLILHKNWGLALTAYNHGPGGVRRAIQAIGTKDIAKIVRSYRSKNFDFASANFYTCFLAALHAHAYRDLLWTDHVYEPTILADSLRLRKSYKPRELVSATGLTEEQLLKHNPELDRAFRKNYFIPKGYRLFLPTDTISSMQKLLAFKQ